MLEILIGRTFQITFFYHLQLSPFFPVQSINLSIKQFSHLDVLSTKQSKLKMTRICESQWKVYQKEICFGGDGGGALWSRKYGGKMSGSGRKVERFAKLFSAARKFPPMANFSGTRKHFRIQLRLWQLTLFNFNLNKQTRYDLEVCK